MTEEAISKFMDLTGVSEEEAKFYVEAAANNVEAALASFFGENNVDSGDPVVDHDTSKSESGNASKTTHSRFKTVSNLAQDSSSDEEEEGEAFFAGGSTHSGQQVLGPPRSRNQIVADMFRSVREHGGEVVSQEAGANTSQTLKFTGTGYRLGQTNNDTQVVSDVTNSSERNNEVTITLKMWRQGFSVNDGPLRVYTEPGSMEFLKTVSRGVIPDELLREARGHQVHLNMEDHSHEEYVLTKPKVKAFSGKGNLLGSVVPSCTTSSSVVPDDSSTHSANVASAQEAVKVDNTKPTTNVQIRLPDGTRLVGNFNHTHTIGDLRTYITNVRPALSMESFRLLTTFPSKELTENSATLAAEGLLNAAILLRLA